MSEQAKLRITGLLILAAFPLYGGGQALLPTANWQLGLALVLANSVGVILIGFLMHTAIADTSPRTTIAYLAGRIAEGILLAIGGLSVVSTSIDWGLSGEDYYPLGMTSLGSCQSSHVPVAGGIAPGWPMSSVGLGLSATCALLRQWLRQTEGLRSYRWSY